MPSFSQRSQGKLITCDQRLQDLFNEVVKHVDCSILCGHRDREDQEKAYRLNRSKAHWPKSRHNTFPSMAVDVAPYPIVWDDINRFFEFAGYVKATARQMGIKVKWGGNFGWFDGPHWEIDE